MIANYYDYFVSSDGHIYNVNTGAKRLYERLGFEDLRQQMSLTLK